MRRTGGNAGRAHDLGRRTTTFTGPIPVLGSSPVSEHGRRRIQPTSTPGSMKLTLLWSCTMLLLAGVPTRSAAQSTRGKSLWLSAALGPGREQQACGLCQGASTRTGIYGSVAGGVAFANRLSLGAELLEWGEVGWNAYHASVQTARVGLNVSRRTTVLLGVGKGHFWVPNSPSREPNAAGPVFHVGVEGTTMRSRHVALQWEVTLRQLLRGRHGNIPTGPSTTTSRGSYLATLLTAGLRLELRS